MVRFAKTYLLPLLPLAALADPIPRIWRVNGLQASDAPVDPSQTDATPALHQFAFSVTGSLQDDATYQCSGEWKDTDFPTSLTKCTPVQGQSSPNVTFNYAVASYASSSGGFEIGLSEFVTTGDVVFEYGGSVKETGSTDGGFCEYMHLENNPGVTFATCNWPTFDIFPNQVA